MSSKSKILATSLLVAAFVAGAVVGGAISSAWGTGWTQGDNAAQERSERSDGSRRRGYGDWLQAELQLTTTQRDSIDAILERRRAEIRRLWQEVGPRFDTLRLEIREQIRETLDDEQRERYQAILVEHDKERHQRNGKRGGSEARRNK